MRFIACVMLWCAAWTAGPARAIDEDDLLQVDQAFALSASATSREQLELKWEIAPGYYLYRHRIAIKSLTADAVLGALALPQGLRKTDEFFGKVETYRDTLIARQALARVPTAGSLEVEVRYQGCADVGICYPPEKRVLKVLLAQDVSANAGSVTGLPARIGGTAPATLGFGDAAATFAAGPLPEEQAFRVDTLVEPGSTAANLRAAVRFTMPPGYYLYRDQTRFALASAVDGVVVGKPEFPPGRSYHDEHFGDVTVYFDQVEVLLPVRGALAGISTLPIVVFFQGCQDGGICYPPMQRTLLLPIAAALAGGADGQAMADSAATTTAPPSAAQSPPDATAVTIGPPLAEDSRIAQSLQGQGRGLALLTFFGLGLLLAFTPCVLPMIPILSGIIAGAGPNLSTRRAVLLSFVYVLASAVVFMVAGVAAGLAGANLQAAFQNPWVLVAFAAIFVGLALSMFGLYELQLPASLQTRLANVSNRQRSGSLGGVAMMGALSALIVGPCVAPPLAGAVLYISQTRDAVFGGLALFLLALGMGAPLLLFGATAGRLMPRAGAWMDAVKAVFGVMFLLLAVWMLERILPLQITMLLLGAVLIGSAVALRALDPLPASTGGWMRVWKSVGVLLLLLGAAQVLGSLAGARDWTRPLAGFGGGATAAQEHVQFRKIKSIADFDRELAAAGAAGQMLLLDFYADWCVSCKEMDKYTFTDAAVIAASKRFVLIKADVTANDNTDKALLKRLELIGPPVTLFFAPDGTERRELRLIGFEKPALFRARLDRAHAVSP